MAHLFDSNNYLRLAEKSSPQRQIVLDAVRKLRANNEIIYYTPQVLAEFWSVCTRPANVRGGLSLSIEQTERKANLIQKHFWLLPDNLAVFTEWRRLVSDYKIKGVQVHDAKLAASMIAHNIQYLITFNEKDFKRFPMITVVNPKDV
ncbi:MAG: type II toxin-antitoxin system VapC family toxin [Acidobacteriota bacterium]|nr:type II toxin-antitoxin system VapC family toxin [Acidobacteriota bacterium]